MEVSEFTLRLLLLFFPGIICAYLVDQFTVHRRKEPFFFLVRSFAFGLGSYFVYWSVKQILNPIDNRISSDVAILRSLIDSSSQLSYREVLFVCITAVAISIIISVALNQKWLFHVGRFFRITKKFGETDVWGYTVNSKQVEWVTVRDHKNDLIYDGWIQAFSDDATEPELLLRDVSVYKNTTGERLYQIGSLYLSMSRDDLVMQCRTIPVHDEILWKEASNE